MNNQSVLDILSNCTTIFLILCVAFALIAVFLFFYLRIREVVLFLTGKTRAAETKRMKDNYSLTGTLQESAVEAAGYTPEPESPETSGLFLTDRLPSMPPEGQPSRTGSMQQPAYTPMSQTEEWRRTFRIHKEIICTSTEETIG